MTHFPRLKYVKLTKTNNNVLSLLYKNNVFNILYRRIDYNYMHYNNKLKKKLYLGLLCYIKFSN